MSIQATNDDEAAKEEPEAAPDATEITSETAAAESPAAIGVEASNLGEEADEENGNARGELEPASTPTGPGLTSTAVEAAPEIIPVEAPAVPMSLVPAEAPPITHPEETPAKTAVPTLEPDSVPVPQATNKKLCGVCKEKEYRYKCPRCEVPYCSIPCLTIHKASHPTLPLKTIPQPPPSLPPKPPSPEAHRPGTKSSGAQTQGPFSPLDASEELKALFKTYPNLRSQLLKIDTATLPPLEPPSGLPHKPGKRKEAPWTVDSGLQKGVKMLKKMRDKEEGIMAYSVLVLKILSGEAGESVREKLEREEREANAQVIQQLLSFDNNR